MPPTVRTVSEMYRAICPEGQTEEHSNGLMGGMKKHEWGNVNSRR